MFDRSSAAYQQLITDIAEAVFSRVDARIVEIDERIAAKSTRKLPAAQLQLSEIPRGALSTLTGRERRVLEGVVGGGSNKSIARELGISNRTVEVHRARALEKLGVQGTAALVSAAIQAGILPMLRTDDPDAPDVR
jgi:DNA-binding NarL/FixJ family response regulator